MKHFKSLEFLSTIQYQAFPSQMQSPPHECKTPSEAFLATVLILTIYLNCKPKPSTLNAKPVVPNRGAAAPYGAIYNTQGCRELMRF